MTAARAAVLRVATLRAQALPAVAQAADYAELVKPRITLLVLLTTLVGFMLGSGGDLDLARLAHAVLATALVAGGASALNQVLERDADARMRRTRHRPLPAGRLRPADALVFGVDTAAIGIVWLSVAVNRASALVALLTLASYVLAYTPLKRRTPWCTVVGAVPGALPPVIGWVAARGELGAGAVALFAILFFWQLPHFYAIGWLYRDDYARAGFPIVPVVDRDGRATARHILGASAGLAAASLAPTLIGMAGTAYAAGAAAFGLAFLGLGIAFARSRAEADARRLFVASLLALPAILVLLVIDRAPL